MPRITARWLALMPAKKKFGILSREVSSEIFGGFVGKNVTLHYRGIRKLDKRF